MSKNVEEYRTEWQKKHTGAVISFEQFLVDKIQSLEAENERLCLDKIKLNEQLQKLKEALTEIRAIILIALEADTLHEAVEIMKQLDRILLSMLVMVLKNLDITTKAKP